MVAPIFPITAVRHFPVALRWTNVVIGRRMTWLPRWPVWDNKPVLSRTRKFLTQKVLPSRWPPVWSCSVGWGLRTSPACSAWPGLPLHLPLWWHLVGGGRGGGGQMCPNRWRPTQGAYHSSWLPAWLSQQQTSCGGRCRWQQCSH